jgi:hypothetical protein
VLLTAEVEGGIRCIRHVSAPRYRKDKDTKESKLLVAVRQDRYVV